MGVIFQAYGATAPFLLGGIGMLLLLILAWRVVR